VPARYIRTSSHILREPHRLEKEPFGGNSGNTRIKWRCTLLCGLPSSGTRPSRVRTGIPGHSPGNKRKSRGLIMSHIGDSRCLSRISDKWSRILYGDKLLYTEKKLISSYEVLDTLTKMFVRSCVFQCLYKRFLNFFATYNGKRVWLH